MTIFAILVIALLSYPIYEFAQSSIVIRHIREQAQLTLDTYTITEGKEVVHSIKSGHDYTSIINKQLFLDNYVKALKANPNLKAYSNEQLYFDISDMNVAFIYKDDLKTYVSFTVHMPLYLCGQKLLTRDIPLSLQSRYNLKY